MSVIGEMADLAAQRARLEVLRSNLGAQLCTYRTAAGISQPQLGHALGRTRSLISKVEHGVRGMPEELWTIADELCGAQGALIAAYTELARAEADHRDRRRTRHCHHPRRHSWILVTGPGRRLLRGCPLGISVSRT